MYSDKILNNDEIRAFHPKHVEEIVLFLRKRGLNIEAFKSITSKKWIVKIDHISCDFNTAKEVVLFLQETYRREKQQVIRDYIDAKLRGLYE